MHDDRFSKVCAGSCLSPYSPGMTLFWKVFFFLFLVRFYSGVCGVRKINESQTRY